MITRACTKCQKVLPATAEFFYKNARGKFGLTPRCKPCVNQDNQACDARRMATNPVRVKAMASARSMKHYHNNLDASRKRHRDFQARLRNDPVAYAQVQAKKRGGGARLSVEEIEVIRQCQNDLCAICSAPAPTDLDHCHSSGRVRWLLCRHCNRGLGAFRDSPEFLRKAAELLETQPNEPVKPR